MEITKNDLELVKSDQGDGGFSIHLRNDLENVSPDNSRPLVSGKADAIEDDGRIYYDWPGKQSEVWDEALEVARSRYSA